jgi:periplasmic copper chaperone A
MRISVAAVFAACLAIIVAASAQTGEATGGIAIVQPWARATPGGAQNGAVYLTIRSPVADRLVAASTPVAGMAQLP